MNAAPPQWFCARRRGRHGPGQPGARNRNPFRGRSIPCRWRATRDGRRRRRSLTRSEPVRPLGRSRLETGRAERQPRQPSQYGFESGHTHQPSSCRANTLPRRAEGRRPIKDHARDPALPDAATVTGRWLLHSAFPFTAGWERWPPQRLPTSRVRVPYARAPTFDRRAATPRRRQKPSGSNNGQGAVAYRACTRLGGRPNGRSD
jgi:hypothetical protein